jgi:uncharacterized protein YfeS
MEDWSKEKANPMLPQMIKKLIKFSRDELLYLR